jgi:ACR3 family arsenite transporter
VFAFAPIVAVLLGVTDFTVPWETLLLSVALYIVLPLIAGALTLRSKIALSPPSRRGSNPRQCWGCSRRWSFCLASKGR